MPGDPSNLQNVLSVVASVQSSPAMRQSRQQRTLILQLVEDKGGLTVSVSSAKPSNMREMREKKMTLK